MKNQLSFFLLMVLSLSLFAWCEPSFGADFQVATGGSHSLALKDDGTIWAWGGNGSGELGDGTNLSKSVPVQIGSDSNWIQVAAGYSSFAIKSDGSLWGWGVGILSPVQIGADYNWQSIAAGSSHVLALKTDKTLWGWGVNTSGQLGDGTTVSKTNPVRIGMAADWQQVTAGSGFSLGLKEDGSLWAWGNNSSGQHGDGTTTGKLVPTRIGSSFDWRQVSAGGDHVAATKQNGSLWTWGANGSGQIGDRTIITRKVPLQIGTTSNWRFAIAGAQRTVAIKIDGSVWSWGLLQALDGTNGRRLEPAQVQNLSRAVAADAGSHILVANENGVVSGWGSNSYGQLGVGYTPSNSPSAQIVGLTSVRSVSLQNHILAVRDDGTVWSWGANQDGQLGDYTTTSRYSLRQIDLERIDAVATGSHHSLAFQRYGSVWAWGDNSAGQLGDGTTTDRSDPTTEVSGLSGIVAISASEAYSLALDRFGSVWRWGFMNTDSFYPLRVTELSDDSTPGPLSGVVAISAGKEHALALKADGSIFAWGDNSYCQLGWGGWPDACSDESRARRVFNIPSGTKAISAGGMISAALSNDGSVYIWGDIFPGTLVDGKIYWKDEPVKIPGLSDVVAISAGDHNLFALKADGTYWEWRYAGGFVEGTALEQGLQQVSSFTGVRAIVRGPANVFAVTTEGRLWGEGNNSEGQLGYHSEWMLLPALINLKTTNNFYNIHINATPGGGIWPLEDQLVAEGETVNFKLAPDIGYYLSSISGCDGTFIYDTYKTATVTADCNIEAVFSPFPEKVQLSLSVDGPGYVHGETYYLGEDILIDCTNEESGQIISCSENFFAGTTLNLRDVDYFMEGYVLAAWEGCDIVNGDGSCTITLNGARQVTAKFRPDYDYDQIADIADNCPLVYNPDQSNIDADSAGDLCDICPGVFPDTCNSEETASEVIGFFGGTIANDKVELVIPQGTVMPDTSFSITSTGSGYELVTEQGLCPVIYSVKLGPEGIEFAYAVTLTFSWTDNDYPGVVDGTSLEEGQLSILKKDSNGEETILSEICDNDLRCNKDLNTFSVDLYSFSDAFLVGPVNRAPDVTVISTPLLPLAIGNEVKISAAFVDEDSPDNHIAEINWGDCEGPCAEPGNVVESSDGTGVINGSHLYTHAGVYVVTLSVTDSRGATGTAEHRYVVVYDPSAGFVTGGGWIDSPGGAYAADKSLSGKANFGFVSRYQKGSSTPTGRTEFQFHAGGFDFRSETYEWLVIAGAKASYKGAGTIKGVDGTFKFLLTAIDAEQNKTDFPIDRFRIKVWSEDEAGSETVVYDNGLPDPDDDEVEGTPQEIAGGSVVIHK